MDTTRDKNTNKFYMCAGKAAEHIFLMNAKAQGSKIYKIVG